MSSNELAIPAIPYARYLLLPSPAIPSHPQPYPQPSPAIPSRHNDRLLPPTSELVMTGLHGDGVDTGSVSFTTPFSRTARIEGGSI